MDGESNSNHDLNSIQLEQVMWAVSNSLPTQQGMRHRQVFQLARHLQGIPGITGEHPVGLFRKIVHQLHQGAIQQGQQMGFTIAGDFEETWSDFQNAWPRVEHPVGGACLATVFDLAADIDAQRNHKHVPWNVIVSTGRTDNRAMRILINILFELSESADHGASGVASERRAASFTWGRQHLRIDTK
ncbi:MAG: hypothetical protein JNL58_05615 [Planctomyces sp.]|nr:hypothetical protein [Planctomyces sp.]